MNNFKQKIVNFKKTFATDAEALEFKGSKGFTLIELIVYLSIVGIILTGISYLILDILKGQASSYSDQEVNYQLRYISGIMVEDIRTASDIASLSEENLILVLAESENIAYSFDENSKNLIRQIGSLEPAIINSENVEITGGFINYSKFNRTKNVGVYLEINYKNPGNIPDYDSSSRVEFTVELRGRR